MSTAYADNICSDDIYSNDICSNIAYATAIKLLSRREYSQAELTRKLKSQHPTADESMLQTILQALQARGLQSDGRYAEHLITKRIQSHYGQYYILKELQQQAIEDDVIQQAMCDIDPDWQQLIKAAYEKKYHDHPPANNQAKQKRKAYLIRKGFSFDQIDSILAA